jgi:ribokinase
VTGSSILVVGSLNADLVVRVPRFPAPGETLTGSSFARFPGGKGANQAYAAARMGGRASLVGQAGDDDLGRWLAAHLAGGGVDVSAVGLVPGQGTGLALITIDDRGQNEIVLVPGANGTFSPDRLGASAHAIEGAALLLLQLEIPLATVTEAARAGRAAGATIVLDPAPARTLPSDLLALVDVLTPNESELAVLTGGGVVEGEDDVRARAERLVAAGARSVLVKWGANGARLFGALGAHAWAAREVPVVDTTAAGDTFNGALAVGLAEGLDIETAGRRAVAAATISVTRPGAQPSMPTRDEVDAMMASGSGLRTPGRDR